MDEGKEDPVRALHLVKTSVGATWALRQMRELVRLGVEVHVALPGAGPLVPQYEAAGVRVQLLQLDLPTGRPWLWPRVFASARELVATVKPAIVHSHFVGTTLSMRLALGRLHPVPRVFQVPGPLHLEHAFFRRAELATAGPVDFWVASCQRTYDLYCNAGLNGQRIFLSYYGADLDRLAEVKGGKLRKELGIGRETKIVGMVAYMYAPKLHLGQTRGIKGHEDLIDAIALCLKSLPNVVCVMVGGAWDGAFTYERRVRSYARRTCGDQIIFLGSRQDVLELYPDFDVAVHPSHSENLGGAAESLLMGIPTIATNIGGFPDLITDGDTGWLVPPRDPQTLAQAIQEALKEPNEARQRGRRGQERALTLLDVRQTAQQVLDIYDEIRIRPRLASSA